MLFTFYLILLRPVNQPGMTVFVSVCQVRERSLESAFIHWYVIMQEDYTGDVLRFMREGTQVRQSEQVSETDDDHG